MSAIDLTRTVADITQHVPGAARAFERLGIDYCCHGKEPLQRACERAQVSLDAALSALDEASREITAHTPPSEPGALVRYLIDHHHAFTRTELTRLAPLADKVKRVHGAQHPELERVYELVEALAEDLSPHMMKEERVLFPAIERLVAGDRSASPFGSIENPIRVMHIEHENVGNLLAELAHVTDRYKAPEGACGSYGALYRGLEELAADIHQHLHLENNVLFPRAMWLERADAQP